MLNPSGEAAEARDAAEMIWLQTRSSTLSCL